MELYNKDGEVVAITIFDKEDEDKIINHKWHFNCNNGYVCAKKNGKYIARSP